MLGMRGRASGILYMLAEERRTRLMDLVRVRRFASLPELVAELHVSESTVRRDVDQLEEQGVARRIHGGVLYCDVTPRLPHFDAQQPERLAEKRAIARRTVELIESGDTVLLDGGSTTYEVARLLVGRPLHVVTNSLPVANLFAADATSDLVMIGGNICTRTGVSQGPYADNMITTLRVRKLILSVAAINDEGFFNNNLLLGQTEQAMMRAADQVIVVADSSKFGHRSLTHLCPLTAVHCLVVDNEISGTWREKLRQAGVNLLVAEPTGCE
jgi:DeoR family transcriptional regulator, fructose operon transcriptional repressor